MKLEDLVAAANEVLRDDGKAPVAEVTLVSGNDTFVVSETGRVS